jgi:hypothetical protein
MKIFGGILIAFGCIWLLSGIAHMVLIFKIGDLSHARGAAINLAFSFLAIWCGLKLYRKHKLRLAHSVDDTNSASGESILDADTENESRDSIFLNDVTFKENESVNISRSSAYKSAFTAAKNSFENIEITNDRYELGGLCHFLIHATQKLFSTYGHAIEHAEAWCLVTAAAVESGKYKDEQIIEAVMFFDKSEESISGFKFQNQALGVFMCKKDRVAIVISTLYFLFPLAVLIEGDPGAMILLMSPLIAYWGYRFVKNDISFFKKSDQ